MVKLYDGGVYLVNGAEIVPESESEKVKALTGKAADKTEAKKGTMAYNIIKAHNPSDDMEQLRLKFDSMTSHDITYVGIIQTARASGMTEFPLPYVLTNCHNSLCAVLVGSAEGELVVVLVDGAADGAEAVVAVGEHVGQRELRHAGGAGRLDDADVGDVVAGHGVKLQAQLLHIVSAVVGLDDAVGHGALFGFGFFGRPAGEGPDLFGFAFGDEVGALYQIDAAVIELDHACFLL